MKIIGRVREHILIERKNPTTGKEEIRWLGTITRSDLEQVRKENQDFFAKLEAKENAGPIKKAVTELVDKMRLLFRSR